MPSVRQHVGAWGEDAAARWYEANGGRIVARNWRTREGELDLVVDVGGGTLAVSEVKARRGRGYGTPFEAVTADKQRRIRGLAIAFLRAHPDLGRRRLRFDVAAVTPDGVEVRTGVF